MVDDQGKRIYKFIEQPGGLLRQVKTSVQHDFTRFELAQLFKPYDLSEVEVQVYQLGVKTTAAEYLGKKEKTKEVK